MRVSVSLEAMCVLAMNINLCCIHLYASDQAFDGFDILTPLISVVIISSAG